jgi:hypothetical protein
MDQDPLRRGQEGQRPSTCGRRSTDLAFETYEPENEALSRRGLFIRWL